MSIKEKIAKRVARELCNGDVVNLGIGLPTRVANYVEDGMVIHLQSENGILGVKSTQGNTESIVDKNIVNAGGKPIGVNPEASYFDSAMSFAIIRGGHVDMTVLGALQVDERGNLASHIIPGKMVPGMGGAMDLVTGAKKVVIAMTHIAKDGSPKILKEINLPATARNKVDLIVTEMAVIKVCEDGLHLVEVASECTIAEVVEKTEATLHIEEAIGVF